MPKEHLLCLFHFKIKGYIKKEYGHVNGKLDKVALTINNMPQDDATFASKHLRF
jgi:hypothetical protein